MPPLSSMPTPSTPTPAPPPPPTPAPPPRTPGARPPAPGVGERLLRRLDVAWLGGRRVAPWVLLTALLVLVVSAAAGAYVQNHPNRLNYGSRAYEIRPDEVRFSFDVEKSPSAVAECTVRARSRNNLVVGRRTDIVVGPASNGQRVMTVSTVVPTSGEAVVVEVEDCVITRAG